MCRPAIEVPDIANDGLTIEKYHYTPCDENSEVLLYKIYNFAHSWLQPNNDLFASQEIWDFFSRHQNINAQTGIENNTSIPRFSLYPNPASDNITIELTTPAENRMVIIRDICGQVVKTISLLPDMKTTLPTGGIGKGIFTVELVENNAVVARQRLVLL